MTHVKLMGELGEKFGSEWQMNVKNFRDIFKLIECQTEGFKQYILDSAEKGIDFTVLNGEDLVEDGLDLMLAPAKDTVVITPVATGAGESDIIKVIVGAVLFFFGPKYIPKIPGTTEATYATTTQTAGGMQVQASVQTGTQLTTAGQLATIGVQMLGVGLAMSGVTGYLTPDSPSEAGDSYLFDGPQNNVKQGVPVPVCYGQLIVGGAVINFGFVEDRLGYEISGYTRITKNENSAANSWEGDTGGSAGGGGQGSGSSSGGGSGSSK